MKKWNREKKDKNDKEYHFLLMLTLSVFFPFECIECTVPLGTLACTNTVKVLYFRKKANFQI